MAIPRGLNPLLAINLPLALSWPRGTNAAADALRVALLGIGAVHQAFLLARAGAHSSARHEAFEFAARLRTAAKRMVAAAVTVVTSNPTPTGTDADAALSAAASLATIDILFGGSGWHDNFAIALRLVQSRGGPAAVLAHARPARLAHGVTATPARLVLEMLAIYEGFGESFGFRLISVWVGQVYRVGLGWVGLGWVGLFASCCFVTPSWLPRSKLESRVENAGLRSGSGCCTPIAIPTIRRIRSACVHSHNSTCACLGGTGSSATSDVLKGLTKTQLYGIRGVGTCFLCCILRPRSRRPGKRRRIVPRSWNLRVWRRVPLSGIHGCPRPSQSRSGLSISLPHLHDAHCIPIPLWHKSGTLTIQDASRPSRSRRSWEKATRATRGGLRASLPRARPRLRPAVRTVRARAA
jgi:hypothetical protein